MSVPRIRARFSRPFAVRAGSALKLPPDAIAEALEKRDDLGSTGIGGGVASRTRGSARSPSRSGCLCGSGTPFPMAPSTASRSISRFSCLLPASSQLDQLNALAAVARKLRCPETLESLRQAKSQAEFYAAITG